MNWLERWILIKAANIIYDHGIGGKCQAAGVDIIGVGACGKYRLNLYDTDRYKLYDKETQSYV